MKLKVEAAEAVSNVAKNKLKKQIQRTTNKKRSNPPLFVVECFRLLVNNSSKLVCHSGLLALSLSNVPRI